MKKAMALEREKNINDLSEKEGGYIARSFGLKLNSNIIRVYPGVDERVMKKDKSFHKRVVR